MEFPLPLHLAPVFPPGYEAAPREQVTIRSIALIDVTIKEHKDPFLEAVCIEFRPEPPTGSNLRDL
jgi:hypothetical protein